MTGPAAASPHRIGRQVLKLRLPDPLGAAQLQEEAVRALRGDGAGTGDELSRLFDRLAGADRVVRLERLEVDLGSVTGDDWPRLLRRRLAERLAERLEEELRRTPAATDGADAPLRRLSAVDAWVEDLVFFLVHGRRRWTDTAVEPPWRRPPEDLTAGAWHPLLERLAADPRARRRLAAVAGDALLAAVVRAWIELPGAAEALAALAPAAPDPPRHDAWRRRFWTVLLDHAAAPPPRPPGRRLLIHLLSKRRCWRAESASRPRDGAAPPAARPAAPTTALGPALAEPWQRWRTEVAALADGGGEAPLGLVPEAGDPSPEAGGEDAGPDGPLCERRTAPREAATPRPGASPSPAPPGQAPPGPADEPAGVPPSPLRPTPPPGDTSLPRSGGADLLPFPANATEKLPRAAGDAVYLPAAGTVLLHPFLPELFRRRDLLDDEGRLRDDAARHHAVHLIGRLGFGAERPEHDLLLAKLLCGMPWEELLPPADLTAADLEACDELLASAIGHWPALRGCSADWLRGQFLLRDGKAEEVDHGWKLTVERRAQDVLLDRLPWGLGLVRLPWLAHWLHVHWGDD